MALFLIAVALAGETISCYERARAALLSEPEAVRLCQFSEAAAPADCYDRANRETILSAAEKVRLCRFANSSAPVDCFIRASRETTLDSKQAIDLCAPYTDLDLPYPFLDRRP